MISKDFADLLEDVGLGIVNIDIFYGEAPDDVDDCLVAVEAGDAGMVHRYTGVKMMPIDIYAHNKVTETGNDKLEAALLALHRREGVTTSDYYIYSIVAMGNIMDLGRDYKGRKVQKQTFDIFYRNLDWIS